MLFAGLSVVHCSGLGCGPKYSSEIGCGPKYSFALSPARIELRTLILWDGRQLAALSQVRCLKLSSVWDFIRVCCQLADCCHLDLLWRASRDVLGCNVI